MLDELDIYDMVHTSKDFDGSRRSERIPGVKNVRSESTVDKHTSLLRHKNA